MNEAKRSVVFINPPTLSRPTGYSHVAVVDGRDIYVSGQVALDATGKIVGAGYFEAQVEQTFLNLGAALAAAGAGWADIAKLTTYVVGLTSDKAAAVRAARAKRFGDAFPASTMIGIEALVDPGLLVEIEAIARTPGR